MRRALFWVAGLTGCVPVGALVLASLIFATDLRAGLIRLATLGVLAAAVLGVVYRTGQRRAFWLGFALLGWGYMALAWNAPDEIDPDGDDYPGSGKPVLFTSRLLDQWYPLLRRDEGATLPAPRWLRRLIYPNPRDRWILAKLDEPVPLRFPEPTHLEEALAYVTAATRGPHEGGIPIYLDPFSVPEGERGPVALDDVDIEGVPLSKSLGLLLRQLDLTYEVRDGLLIVTTGSLAERADPFRRIGHCYWALLAAGLGGAAGRWLYRTRAGLPGHSRTQAQPAR